MNFAFIFLPFFGFGFVFYVLSSIIALARSKRNALSIFLPSELLPRLDAYRMVVALVWAVKVDDPAPVR
jgi:hypothetical protein